MTTSSKQRSEARVRWARLGGSEAAFRVVARNAATVHRLAEAVCNGDYPCDDGNSKPTACPVCEIGYRTAAAGKIQTDGSTKGCVSCRADARLTAACLEAFPNYRVELGGDPRGATVRLYDGDREVFWL